MTTIYERRGGESLANSTFAGAQYSARIAYLTGGRFVLVWRDDSAFEVNEIDVRGQIFNADGTKSGVEFAVATAIAGRQTDPAPIALADGGFIVSWTAQATPGTDDYNIVAQRFAADGSRIGGEIAVADGAPAPQNSSAGAALVGGGYILAWTDWAGDADDPAVPFTARGIRAQLFQPDGTPDGPAFSVNTTTAGQQANPSVAALPDGGWLVVWDDAGGTGGIAGQRYAPDGTKAGTEFLVSTENAGTQIVNVVAILEGGGFVVAWQDTSGQGGDASSGAIKARVYGDAGAAVGGEILVNSNTAGNQYGPAVTAIAGGGFVIAWSDTNALDGSGSSVRAQTFDAAGAKVGAERAINSVTAGHQSVSDIAAFEGGYTIVWTDDSGQGADAAPSSVKFARFVATTATEGGDVRTGTDGVDDLYGLGGDDSLSGGGGADVLVGGDGNDSIDGGDGDDQIDGGGGNDILGGGEGNDLLDGGEGEDVADGGAGDDRIVVAAGASGLDVATGGTGTDRLTASFAAATSGLRMSVAIGGGGGYEGWIGASADAPLLQLSGIEQLHLTLGNHADEVAGGDLDDTIAGMAGDDLVAGGGGNDVLDGGVGSDRLEGGAGNDYYVVDDAGDLAVEQAGAGTDTVIAALGRYALSVHLENLTGSAAAQTLSGNHLANIVSGEGGDDVIEGGAGTDTLNGGSGNDVITDAGGGEDVLNGGDGDDALSIYHYGWDRGIRATLNGGAGSDSIVFDGAKFAAIDAGAGDDVVRIVNASDAYISLGAGRDTAAWDNWTSGQSYLDVQTHYITDFQVGSYELGADRLDLHTMFGRTLANWDQRANPFTSGAARLNVYQGVSVVSVMFNGYMTEAIEIQGRALSFTEYNLGGFSTSSAPAAATTRTGTEAGEIIYGGAGADTINGLGGNDRIEGGFGGDVIDGGEGDDVLNGQTGDDTVQGGGGNDRLEDHAGGEDMLSGGDGNDFISASRNLVMVPRAVTLSGGAGNDVIWFDWLTGQYESSFDRNGGAVSIEGGTGADTIVLWDQRGAVTVDLGADSDVDLLKLDGGMRALSLTVTNFTPGDGGDAVDMADHLARTLGGWDQRTNPFASGHLALVAYDGGTRLMIDRDGGGNSWVEFITFADAAIADFTAANFLGHAPDQSDTVGALQTGTDGDDRLQGGVGDDELNGGGGDDAIVGGVGADLIDGGDGHDRLFGGGGDDEVHGGAGDDYLDDPKGGADALYGGAGHDRIDIYRAPTAAATLTARLFGEDGEDRFSVNIQNASRVEVDGGAGDDHVTFYALKGTALVTLGAGRDIIRLNPDYFGPHPNQTRVNEIVIADFQAGPGGDFLDLKQALDFGAMHWPDDGEGFRQGSLRLLQDGADTLVQYTYSSSGPFQTLFRFTGLAIDDFTSDNFAMELPDTLVLSTDGEQVVNSRSFYGRPAVHITGDNVHFTNAAGATIARAGETGTDLAAIRVDGDGVTIVNEFGATIRGGLAIEGTEFADTILNYGLISGAVQLGGGADYFFEKVGGHNNSSFERTPVDLGAGDDIAEFHLNGGANLEFPEITGGGGFDKAIIGNFGPSLRVGLSSTLDVEEIRLLPTTAASNVTFTAKAPASDLWLAPGLKLTISDSLTATTPESRPASGTVHLEGGSLSYGLFTVFSQVLGTDAAETVQLVGRTSAQFGSPTRNGQILLGGGDDVFMIGPRHVSPVSVQGGTGDDRVEIVQSADFSFAAFSGFETIVHSMFPANGAATATLALSGIGTDVERLLLAPGLQLLLLSGLATPGLAIGAGAGRLLIGADSVVGSLHDRSLIDPALLTTSAQAIENRGTVIGAATFAQGRDGFTNLGSVGGDVDLGADDDSFTGAAGSSVAGAVRGGTGNDVYTIEAPGYAIVELDGEGQDEIRTSLAGFTLADGLHVEKLTGLSGAGQALSGNALANEIAGGAGNDMLAGGDGNDTLLGGGGKDSLDGGSGDDAMAGGSGDDVYFVSDAGDSVTELADGGSDEIRTALAGYTIAEGVHVETLTGLSPAGQALSGNSRDNAIAGAGGNDVIDGGGGNDRLDGGAGDDAMTGGAGDDVFTVRDAGDTVAEGQDGGNDEIRTDLARFAILESVHVEKLTGLSAAGQALTGNGLANVVTGNSGDDVLDGGGGDDALAGGHGNDLYFVDSAGDTVAELADQGTDEIRTSAAAFAIAADSHVEALTGLSGAGQTLTGNGFANTILGGSGDDVIDGGGGDDAMAGGSGDDAYVVGSAGDSVTELADSGTDEIRTTLASFSLSDAVHVETLTGLSGAGQTLTGNGFANRIAGGGGSDVLNGAGGDDLLDGGAGADRMTGGAGNDVYVVDNADDVVIEAAGGGSDEVRTSLASYAIPADVELLVYTGAGAFQAQGSNGNDRIRGGAGDDSISGEAGNDTLFLDAGGDDSASGGAGEDIFFYGAALTAGDSNDGGTGTDTLVLQGGYAGLTLGAGTLVGIEGISLQGGSITRWGGGGTATHDYDLTMVNANTAAGQQLRINAQSLRTGEDFRFDGSAETDGGRFLIYAGFGVDQLTGGSGHDIFYFEAGRFGAGDRIVGGAGSDAVVISGVPVGSATLSALVASGTFSSVESLSFNGRFATDLSARPSYELVLENGNIAPGTRLIVNGSSLGADQSLTFDGSSVADGHLNIFGGLGNDRLTGGANADIIYAGGGADLLTGGGGKDIFQYRNASDSLAAPDRIADFVIGDDRIDLAQIDANANAAGDQAFQFIGEAAFGGVAGQLRIAFTGPNLWTVTGDLDGDSDADFILEVTGVAGQPLVAADFLL